ncbi:unnamed protein product (macronuclear) [Paramecium tetraurelia]|uniref:N-alpha-acetyltransferase 60 n=1 Tax=Paramecium tetraurelia TaxID=5888 RepID=A0EI81_PARTE|nr:uncharacterized protein GSPATT00027351001 [Paramecium tetraurelia]CAK95022.1 unnamed protein product [Paramecium tetraurelia]|eukprot:XP_001462395.1 hypothetical protein (macronuclear) [Paramecium tetraurelia strain d4-2]
MQQIDQRLSQAYPPNSQNNTRYIAEIHSVLANVKIDDIGFKDIKFRKVQTKRDLEQLKLLQQEWFPITYGEQFYNSVLNGRVSSLIAEIEIKYPTGRKEKYVIGAMVYQQRQCKTKYLQNLTWKQWFCLFFQTQNALYIMTIGVINEFRGRGIAEYMVEQLKKTVLQSNKTIAYIYLDMVDYNEIASRFYQKQGFNKMRIKKNHYMIENQTFDGYVYVWQPI